MTNIRAELSYSYRRYFPVIADVNDDNRTLSTIEHLLVNAGQACRDRRYQDAIDLYNQVRSLLWSQLYPLVNFDEKRAWSVNLRRSFVSYSAEWLNLLPIEHVAAGVRPREVAAIESGTLLGLHSNNVDFKGAGAVADMNLADMLAAQGNTASAQFFKNRPVLWHPIWSSRLKPSAALRHQPLLGAQLFQPRRYCELRRIAERSVWPPARSLRLR